MQSTLMLMAVLAVGQPDPLGVGDHKRTITVDELKRIHWIHVPPKYDPKQPAAVVLALHGAMMDAKLMETFSNLNATADKHNFIVVYPNGTGPGGFFQTWNAGLFPGELNKIKVDDVKYLGKVLDDVESVCKVDKKRVYVAGLSNGAMMSYRLAAEMSDRIAAIAPVAGTMAVEKYEPKRPVPVLHIHGTKDLLVPFNGPAKPKDTPKFLKFLSVDDTIMKCVKANGCADKPTTAALDPKVDKIKVTRKTHGQGKNGSEVVLYVIEDGGHVWPGSDFNMPGLGTSTKNILANELIWEFFRKHAMK